MIEHVLIAIVQALTDRQQEQRELADRQIRVRIAQARADTTGQALDEGIVIPPKGYGFEVFVLSWFSSVLVVGLLNAAVFIGLAQAQRAPGLDNTLILVSSLIMFVVGVFGFTQVFRRSLRGVELRISRSGAEFRYGDACVRCPWELFRSNEDYFGDAKRVIIPVAAQVVHRVEMLKHDGIVGTGLDVQFKPLRFVSDRELEMRSAYRLPLAEVAGILQEFGHRLG